MCGVPIVMLRESKASTPHGLRSPSQILPTSLRFAQDDGGDGCAQDGGGEAGACMQHVCQGITERRRQPHEPWWQATCMLGDHRCGGLQSGKIWIGFIPDFSSKESTDPRERRAGLHTLDDLITEFKNKEFKS